jgi:predicted nucleotidyltransferase
VRRGKPLGRPNPAIKLPSRYAITTLSRRHGLASLKLFGSAVRNDFRPDSDVDVLVRFRPGVRPTMESMASLEAELERLLARDVELTREEALRAPIESEAVSLL